MNEVATREEKQRVGELVEPMSCMSRENGVGEFSVVAESMLYEHDGPGHKVSKEVDPETGDGLLICDRCEQVLCLTSDGFPDLEGDEFGLLPDLLARR